MNCQFCGGLCDEDSSVCDNCADTLDRVHDHWQAFNCTLEESVEVVLTRFTPEQRQFALNWWKD